MTAAPVRPLPRNTVIAVAGVSFRQEDVRTVVENDELRIRHDVGNTFDAHACEVLTLDGRRLGYVPQVLAPRLAGAHPGGLWRARVAQAYRNDTWGLRIQLGDLVRAGTALDPTLSLRHRGDGTTEGPDGELALAAADTAPADTAPAVGARASRVYAKSGRLLGDLLEVDGSRVRVRTTTGMTATYPGVVVQVRPAA